eukprot:651532-Pleurochrysis_carterae.AAC.2
MIHDHAIANGAQKWKERAQKQNIHDFTIWRARSLIEERWRDPRLEHEPSSDVGAHHLREAHAAGCVQAKGNNAGGACDRC